MKRGFLSRLKHLFIPGEGNSYRPHLLRKKALLAFLVGALLVESLLAAGLIAQTPFKEFFAAVLPISIESFTNEERATASLPSLSENRILATAAQMKADDMAAEGYFSHQSPDGRAPWDFMTSAGYDYRYAGENLAVHFYDSADVVSAWMDSPSHRANIVKPVYTEIGIGVANGRYEGKETTFVVQFFGTPQKKSEAASSVMPVLAKSEPPVERDSLSQVAGESVAAPNPSTFVARMIGSPRTMALFILSGFLGLLLVGVFLTLVVKVQIQPLDLLANGALVAVFLLGLIVLNDRFFASPLQVTEQAASTLYSVEGL